MAANSLLDRGWGKAAQLVDIQGDVEQIVEVKLSVVDASHALPSERVLELEAIPVGDTVGDKAEDKT